MAPTIAPKLQFALPTFGRWWCIQTKPQQEMKLANELWAHNVGYYLPTISREGRSGGKRVTRLSPVWPGYLFLRGSDYDVFVAKQTGRTVNVLHVPLQDLLTRELHMIATAIASGNRIEVVPFVAGDRVRVSSGKLMGIEGIVVGGGKRGRLIMTAELMGSAVSVELNGCEVELISQK